MAKVQDMLQSMQKRYKPGGTQRRTYYFSIGEEKWTVTLLPDRCEIAQGKPAGDADCVLKTTPEIFSALVLEGKAPGALDIARGRFKTNDVGALSELKERFGLGG